MTQEDPQEYSFLITVPKERLQDMQQAMEQAQLPFHPLRDITADVDAFMPGVNLGSDIPGAVEEINKYLAFFDDHPRVPSDYDTWTPERATPRPYWKPPSTSGQRSPRSTPKYSTAPIDPGPTGPHRRKESDDR